MAVNSTTPDAHTPLTDVVFDDEFLCNVVKVPLAHFLEAITDLFLNQFIFFTYDGDRNAIHAHTVCIFSRFFR